MSLNIKSPRAVELVRALAARTGSSQTAAVEDAVARRLTELDREDDALTQGRSEAAEDVLSQLHRLLTEDDKRAIRQTEADLYDVHGLPR